MSQQSKLVLILLSFTLASYCNDLTRNQIELRRIRHAAAYGANLGIEIHAGHGLGFDTVGPIASIPEIEELNIGHFLIGESVFCGLETAITRMRQKMQSSRCQNTLGD